MTTLVDVIASVARRLVQSGCFVAHHYDNALDEARELVLFALHLPHDFPANYSTAVVLADELAAIDLLLARRITQRIPASYLTGTAYFAGLAFSVDQRALIPRSPIAQLIQQGFAGLCAKSPETVLDLCTGSGCIGIACAFYLPQAEVLLADISDDALALARVNLQRHGRNRNLMARVRLRQSDLFVNLANQQFDLIVSNPPYVTEAEYAEMAPEYAHEPKLGLTSGTEGLDHPLQILQQAVSYLTADGVLILEMGDAWRALLRRYPNLPGRWLDFSLGHNMGVLHITRSELASFF